MAAVQSASDIRRRKRDNKSTGRVGGSAGLRLEIAALLPPGVPGRLDSLRVVGLEVGGIERLNDLFLAGLGGVLEGREGFDNLLGLLWLLRLRFPGVLLLQFFLFGSKLGGLLSASLLIRLCGESV